MNNSAFFFQGNNLLLPAGVPDTQMDSAISLDFAREFNKSEFDQIDVFEIPAVKGDRTITCVSLSPEYPLPAAWRAVPIRQGISLLNAGLTDGGPSIAYAQKPSIGRLLRAFHIAQWRRESRFCGSCGAKNTESPGELARLCPVCGRQEFPRISPAVITIIINDEDKALLAHNKKFLSGVYSLIAGFNEAGENLEATVVREIREEVNINVRDVRYIASQPWPFPNSLMLGFSARYASGTIRADGVEIEDAQWFSRDALPKLPGTGSVSRYLIGRWIAGSL
ncbi:MAG: NAD(+) diphosphatase [Treponema sp.]|nr:NAD(+) diphosphatase [Treponema sp.]